MRRRSVHLSYGSGYGDYGQVNSIGLSQLPASSPHGTLWSRSFDKYGRLASITDRNGVITTFGYDLLDRMTNRIVNDGSVQLVSTETFAYTTLGLSNHVDELGHTNWFGLTTPPTPPRTIFLPRDSGPVIVAPGTIIIWY